MTTPDERIERAAEAMWRASGMYDGWYTWHPPTDQDRARNPQIKQLHETQRTHWRDLAHIALERGFPEHMRPPEPRQRGSP